MRPIKLMMTAFGPYREQETIDFEQLEDRRLFVISGMTGAGKTTIFDAISYALYGSASGEDRSDFRMLRSHFADDDVHTAVDFIFAVGRRTYRVFRQMGHRKRNNKNETGSKIELYETTGGEETPCVDRFTVGDVNAKLEEIIGLTKEQFNQIVMLPQGEFRKLLTSDTENKEEILRRIFRTGRYQLLEERFYEKSKQLRERHKDVVTKLNIHMQQAAELLPDREGSALSQTLQQEVYSPSQMLDGLSAEQTYYELLADTANERRKEITERLTGLEREHRAASELNRQFAELHTRRSKLEELEQQKEAMDNLERKIKFAEKAAHLKPFEEHATRAVKSVDLKRQQHEAKQRLVENAVQQLEKSKAAYVQEKEREEDRKKADLALSRLKEFVPIVASLQSKRQEVERLQSQNNALAERRRVLDEQIAKCRQKKDAMSQEIQRLEEATAGLPDKLQQLERLRHKARLLQELVHAEKQLEAIAKIEEERVQQLASIREEHDRIEAAWIEGQAGMLAMHLHDGMPCPVCGSTEHPHKAVTTDELPSRESLNRRKEELRRAEQEMHAAQAQIAAARASRHAKADEMAEYGIESDHYEDQLNTVIAEGKQASRNMEQLQQQSDQLTRLRQQWQQLLDQTDRLLSEREQVSQHLQSVAVLYSKESSLLENELARIPESLRTQEQLERSIAEQQTHVDALSEAWNRAQQQLQQAEKQHVELKAEVNSLAKQWEEAAADAEYAQERFAAERTNAGFDTFDLYEKAKAAEEEREAWSRQLDQYRQALMIVRQQIAELEKELQDKQPVEMAVLDEAILQTKQELDRTSADVQTAQRYQQDAAKLRSSIEQVYEKVRQLESELEKVLDIYQVLKGDNPLRMSFERYILIEYLEQILHASNVRLQHLSNGQYLLQRSDRLEARGRQSGLGLDVYDAYTGQNRDVKTLSGGEKFNASLALALGMTDVIQAHQGGVSIEMMFIDEGFGSLDEESLHKAVTTLVDLQKTGRMIGVISHVQELKQAFPAVLEVKKTKEGSSTTEIRIK